MPSLHRIAVPLLLCAAAVATPIATRADDVIEYRQGVMTVFSWNLSAMGSMVKGETPFDPAAFKGYATDLATAASLNVLKGFPEDSLSDDSDAKEDIWLNWADFEARYKALKEAAAKLSEVAATGEEAAMRAQFKEAASACKACHRDFKR
jgi:cytochrome c556